MACGALPTAIVFSTPFVRGSIRDTEAVNSFDTHTLPPVTATPSGPFPTGINWMT